MRMPTGGDVREQMPSDSVSWSGNRGILAGSECYPFWRHMVRNALGLANASQKSGEERHPCQKCECGRGLLKSTPVHANITDAPERVLRCLQCRSRQTLHAF